MPKNADDFLLQALQALGLLPEAITTAERAFQRARTCIASIEEDIRERNKERKGRELPMTLVSSLLRNQLETADIFGLDSHARNDVRAAIAICKIRDIARATKEYLAESKSAPRRAKVRDLLIFLAAHGKAFSTALKSPYVADALDRELAIEASADKRTGKRRQRHTIRSLLERIPRGHSIPYRAVGHIIRVFTILAERALERRVPLIAAGHLEYGRPYYEDRGGDGTAYSIDRLPLKQGFVMRCLALFGKYRPEIATGVPDRPFAKFTQSVWSLAAGEEESLERAMTDVFKAIRDDSASPTLLDALLDLPEKTLPPDNLPE